MTGLTILQTALIIAGMALSFVLGAWTYYQGHTRNNPTILQALPSTTQKIEAGLGEEDPDKPLKRTQV